MASPRNRKGKEELERIQEEERMAQWDANDEEGALENERDEELIADTNDELTKSGQQRASHYSVSHSGEIKEKKMAMIDPQDLGLGGFQEPIAMPDGFEAHLRIVSVRKAVNKNGEDYLQPLLEIIDEPLAKDFTAYLVFPTRETMSPKQFQRAGFQLQEFMQGFGIPLDEPTDPTEQWAGYEGWNILGVTENTDYGRQNKLGKFIRGE